MTDRLGILSATSNKSAWRRFRDGYTVWVVILGLSLLGLWSYVAATGLPALLLLIGLPLLGHLFLSKGSWKAFAPFTITTGLLLLIAFFRSDFVEAVAHGVPLAKAYAGSQLVIDGPVTIVVPAIIWCLAWAMIFAARSLDDRQALKVFHIFGYVLLALTAVQFIEAISQFGLRRSLSAAYFHSRDNMLIVGMSNTNCVLLMMFWPFALVAMSRGHRVMTGFMAVAIIAGALTSDNNAQLIALIASAVVFFAVKYWPRALKALPPERLAAFVSLIPMLLFPLFILAIMHNGMAEKIKTDILPSWAARIDIWTFTVERALETPIWGLGYESSRHFGATIPNHPHNMALQAWLELGIPGLLVLAAFWFCLFWNMKATGEVEATQTDVLRSLDEAPRPINEISLVTRFRPYLMAQATSFLIIGTVSYGLWRAWVYCLGAFAVTAMVLAIRAARQSIKLRN
jgi:O-antigen ligase